jgi:hypothetical protein
MIGGNGVRATLIAESVPFISTLSYDALIADGAA